MPCRYTFLFRAAPTFVTGGHGLAINHGIYCTVTFTSIFAGLTMRYEHVAGTALDELGIERTVHFLPPYCLSPDSNVWRLTLHLLTLFDYLSWETVTVK